MPNWCVTRYIATGKKEELSDLVKTLNTMPNIENGFGKWWCGNFVVALGECLAEDVANTRLDIRGTFDPFFEQDACFGGPEPDEEMEFDIDEDGRLFFSITTAWGRSKDIERIIQKHWPFIELSWSTTDEFDNFHSTYNPNSFKELSWFNFGGDVFSRTEEDMRYLNEKIHEYITDDELPEVVDEDFIRSDKFKEIAERASEKNDDIYYSYYEEVLD